MRRFLMGVVWFVILYEVPLMLGGGLAGARATAGNASTFSAGYATGYEAGRGFAEQWGGVILVLALLLAVVGTIAGRLPGTSAHRPVRA